MHESEGAGLLRSSRQRDARWQKRRYTEQQIVIQTRARWHERHIVAKAHLDAIRVDSAWTLALIHVCRAAGLVKRLPGTGPDLTVNRIIHSAGSGWPCEIVVVGGIELGRIVRAARRSGFGNAAT